MYKRASLLTIITSFGIAVCSAQTPEQTAPIDGKPILTVFADYKAGLGNVNDVSGFNLNRAFIGYEASLPKGFSAKVVMNIETNATDDGKTKFGAYIKNAQINWKKDGFSTSFGLVNLNQFSVQENAWGHRYVARSFQEEYGFAYCEDIGIVANYEFSPSFSTDVAFTNGEGRKFKNDDNNYRYGAGITWLPAKGIVLRGYADVHSRTEKQSSEQSYKDQYSLALFAGYKHRLFSIGAEFNKSYNHHFIPDAVLTGYSVYSTIPIYRMWQCYGRFDLLDASRNDISRQEGNLIILGIDYQPIPYLRLSPNIQSWKGKGQARDNYLLVSAELKI